MIEETRKMQQDSVNAILELQTYLKSTNENFNPHYDMNYYSEPPVLNRNIRKQSNNSLNMMRSETYNKNPSNNSWNNLRQANKSENNINRKIQANNTTGYKGVSYRKDRNKYQARIFKDNIKYSLGCFKTAKEAALAYNAKAIELHGEFATLNVIED